MKKYKFKKGLKIDRYVLDQELVKQPQLYSGWAIKEAEAANEKEWEKHRLELIRAQVEIKIRKDPEEYGIQNITEGIIKASITSHKKVRRQTKKYLEALHNERVLKKAERSYKARQKMLEGLVHLNVQLNFAEVKVPRAYSEKRIDDAKDSLRRDLKRKQKKRGRK